MAHTLYLECNSGISGDMVVGALLDLGADEKKLRETLATLPLSGYTLQISRVKKAGLDCCDFLVQLDAEHENHDHDMEYLYGFKKGEEPVEAHGHHHDEHQHEHHHDHDHEHDHEHDHDHEHEHHHHHHEHRGLTEVLAILEQGRLTPGALQLAETIFTILGEAEAKAHGTTLDEVHFHEVGAVDSIVDIAAAAICLDDLGIRETIIPVLNEGKGSVRCAHGILPIPVPAVANIAAAHGLPLQIMDTEGEYVTPTGAAIAAAIRTGGTLPRPLTIRKIGLGAGKRQQARPSLLRAMLIEGSGQAADGLEEDSIWKLETNLDDCTGEALGHVLDLLLAAGARDVQYTPVYMKKNRPAWLVTVLCKEPERARLEAILFRETTTIGIRRVRMDRTILPRTERQVETPWGPVRVKEVRVPGLGDQPGEVRLYPEYESLRELCRKTGRSYQTLWQQVLPQLATRKEG